MIPVPTKKSDLLDFAKQLVSDCRVSVGSRAAYYRQLNLIAETGRQLNTHVEKTTQFASNPLIGIEKMKEMFDQTFKAMDAMDTFRSKMVEVMGQNNTILQAQLARADQHIDRVRQQKAREVTRHSLSGPVAL